jgi:putative MATE family efflux protein
VCLDETSITMTTQRAQELTDIADLIVGHLNRNDLAGLAETIAPCTTPELVEICERLGDRHRAVMYRLLPPQRALEVFEALDPALQGDLVRGLQDATLPLVVAVGGALVNIPLNAMLIFGLDLGIAGSAIGTVIAQWGMALVLLGVIVHRARREGIGLGLQPANLVAVGKDAVPMFVRTLSLRVVIIASTVVATGLGDVQLAAHQLTTTVFTVLSLALDSLAIAGQALTGRYLGASDPRTVHAVTRRLMVWGVGGGAVVAVGLLAASYVVPGLFTPDAAVQESLRAALWVLVIAQPIAGYVFVLDGVLMGAGDAPYLAKVGSLIAVAIVPAAIAVALWAPGGPLGLALLWLACNFLFMVLRAISLGLRVRTDAWMRWG